MSLWKARCKRPWIKQVAMAKPWIGWVKSYPWSRFETLRDPEEPLFLKILCDIQTCSNPKGFKSDSNWSKNPRYNWYPMGFKSESNWEKNELAPESQISIDIPGARPAIDVPTPSPPSPLLPSCRFQDRWAQPCPQKGGKALPFQHKYIGRPRGKQAQVHI